MVSDATFISAEEFSGAFESILQSFDLEFSRYGKPREDEAQDHALTLYKLITSQRCVKSCGSDGNLLDLCESIVNDWEESASPTTNIQQLVSLLNKPFVKALFSVYDNVKCQRYSPQLPEVPFEVDDDEGVAVKIVRLIRGTEPLGATIKCDSNGAVFIARVIAGGVADRSACIQVGDRLMEVNNVPVTGIKPTEIVKLLNDGSGTVIFKLVPARIPTIVENSAKRFLRTLADYSGSCDSLHPCPEAALSFRRGEILELLVTADEHWWQAKSFGYGAFAHTSQSNKEAPEKVGLVPSELLHSKIRAQRDFDERTKQTRRTSRTCLDSPCGIMYEPVCLAYPDSSVIRPVVLIGPAGVGRNELKRRLIMSNCDRFATTIPHTSRPPRANETLGVDYHFAKREVMEQWVVQGRFLEFGEYKGNIYGTLIDSVVEVIKKGRTPILNPHPLALRILRTADFKAFVIFVCPPSFEKLKETRQQHILEQEDGGAAGGGSSAVARGFTETDLEQMILSGEQLYELYGHCFDMILVNDSLDAAVKQLCQAVSKLDNLPSWVPTSWI